jgi:hypothetical protein
VTAEIKPLRAKVDSLEAELAGIRNNAIYQNAFEWRFEFPAVLGADGEFLGFDVVVGNPPYVDIKAIDKSTVKYLFENYKTSTNRINLYAAFIELASRLNSIVGQLSFIVPNSMLVGSSYATLREQLMNKIARIIKLPDGVFEEATVETIILDINSAKEPLDLETIVYPRDLALENITLEQLQFVSKEFLKKYSGGTFNLYLSEKIGEILVKSAIDSKSVESITDISLGITPYDKYQGHSKETIKNRAFHSKTKENEFYKPLVSGSDIRPYYVNIAPKEFINYGEWLGSARSIGYFTLPRNIVRQIVGDNLSLISGYTEDEAFFTQIGFAVISNDSKFTNIYLTAIFNSTLLAFIHKYLYLDIEKTVFQKVLIQNFKQLPIKISPSSNFTDNITTLVTQILTQKQSDPTADTTSLEAEIDVLVYKLYGLTYAEVLVVDGAFGLSEEEYNVSALPG